MWNAISSCSKTFFVTLSLKIKRKSLQTYPTIKVKFNIGNIDFSNSKYFTVKIVDLLYECIMCSLSPCIKSTALRFKIPRESLHIPMDKRAQQLIDPIGISRRWFFKTCLLGLTCHQIYFSMCTCKM